MIPAALCAIAMNCQELPKVEMGKAQLVFLVTPADPPKLTDEETSAKQAAHLNFLNKLWDKRTALVVGPLVNGGRLRGIVLLDVQTPEEAKAILADDPYVSAGALGVETHTWFFAKNYIKKGAAFMGLETYWFGMLERSPGLPTLSEEEGQKMQAGHMANIQKMAQEGALLLAGPMVEDTPFRGIFVFRDMPKEEVEKLTAVDPLIKAGRLKLKLFQWMTSKGSFVAEKGKE